MTHVVELLLAIPLLYVAFRFANHEMKQRDALSEDERAALQDDEGW